jgi:tetratricopeptide (TPR) repeat protein
MITLMTSPRRPALLAHRRRRFAAAALAILALLIIPALWLRGELVVRREALAAREALDQGRLDDAAALLDRWLGHRPRAAEAHYLKARLAWARHDLGTVQQELDKAGTLGYPPPMMSGLRGLLLARTGPMTEAEPLLVESMQGADRVDPEVAETLARHFLGSFRLGRASEVIERWIRDWPDDARPYFLRTEIETRNNSSAEIIIASYREALRRDPDLDAARLRLADSLRLNHRNAEAAEEYAVYLQHRPDDPLGHLGAGQNALDQTAIDEAVRHLDRALSLSPKDPVILGARATVESRQGHFEEALRYLDRAVAADPFDASNRYQRMIILNRLGKKEQADADRRAVEQIRKDEREFAEIGHQLRENPLDLQLRRRAAHWLMEHGHEAEAVDWARLVLQSIPADPEMNRLLADYYRRQGNAGLANFHEAHAAAPAKARSSTP